MRRARKRLADEPAERPDPVVVDRRRIRANGLPVLPLRLFLAALFCFAGYAKFSYPHFFDPSSPNGFKAAVDAARHGTPIGGAMGPLVDHPELFGHVTAVAEIAIGLGLLVGLLTRVAALGGMVLTTLILLSIDWNGVKEYTGSSGWFTAVDLAVAAALSVFLLGGAGPFALDNLFIRARERQRARDEAEPSFRASELDDSRRRLQGEPATAQLPAVGGRDAESGPASEAAGYRSGDRGATGYRSEDRDAAGNRTEDRAGSGYRPEDRAGSGLRPADRDEAGYRTVRQEDEEYRDDPEPEPNSLWTEGRRPPGQPPAEPRRESDPPSSTDSTDR